MQYDLVVYIGRFEPPHLAHIKTIREGLKQGEQLLVLAGSHNQPRTWRNPFSTNEREEMIRASIGEADNLRLRVEGLRDKHDDEVWAAQVQSIISHRYPDAEKIAVIGYEKDDTSYYLAMFPQWAEIRMPNIDDIHASDIRVGMFECEDEEDFELAIGRNLPRGIHDWIQAWMMTDAYEQLRREYHFTKKYKEFHEWEGVPYKPKYITTDAVVVQSGHVLLVRRRSEPGKGLWALPGGHLGEDMTLLDSMVDELKTESKLKLPPPVIKGSIKATQIFDKPGRSLRGRTVSVAYHISLPPGPLPKVKGGDDADKARWVPISVVAQMEDQLFEDHYHIIGTFVDLEG